MGVQDNLPAGEFPIYQQDQGIAKQFPGLEFFGQEPDAKYDEIREVNGEFWIVQNATYNNWSQQWLLVDPTKNARALVMASGGKLAFRTSPAELQPCNFNTVWYITDGGTPTFSGAADSVTDDVDLSAIGIYNVLHYGAVPNDDTQGATNVTAFQAAINDAVTAGGGTVLIPSGQYYINAALTVGPNAHLAIVGTDDGSQIIQTANADIFDITSNSQNFGGVNFQNLFVTYEQGVTGIGFNVLNSQNVNFSYCDVSNCPTGWQFIGCNQCSIDHCTAKNGLNPVSYLIYIGGVPGNPNSGCSNIYVTNSVFGCSGAAVNSGLGLFVGFATGLYVVDVQFSNFGQGIQIAPEGNLCQTLRFTNVLAESVGGAVYLQPNNSGQVFDVLFDGCLFRFPLNVSTGLYTASGVYVDTDGMNDSYVDTIQFIGCTVYNWPGPGLQINAGRHMDVIGGLYASNSLQPGTPVGGISITGPANYITINGADCSSNAFGLGTQPQSLYITQASYVLVVGCTFLHSVFLPNGPVTITDPGSTIELYNNIGYNDQGTVVTQTPPSSGVTFYPNTVGSTKYYGPVEFYISNNSGTISEIDVDATNTQLLAGSFYLMPGEDGAVTYGSGTIYFVAIGK